MDNLATTDLSPRDRVDPGDTDIDRNSDHADDPESLAVVGLQVAEDDGEDDTTQVTSGTSYTRDDTVGVWMNMRNDGKDSSIGSLEEESHPSDKTEHGGLVLGVQNTDGNLESTGDDGKGMEPCLLTPDGPGLLVEKISDDTTDWAADNVEETEHGCPSTTASLQELGELLEVVGTEDRVDGKLSTECTEVAEGDHDGLEREDDPHGLLERWLNDDFTLSSFNHTLLAHCNLVGEVVLGSGDISLLVKTLLIARSWWCGLTVLQLLIGNTSWNSDESIGTDTMSLKVLLHSKMAVAPLPSWCVLAAKDESNGDSSNQDEWNDECDSPCNVSAEVLLADKRIEDGWHDEEGNPTACVTEASCEGVGCADNVLVEESSGPHLARHKRTTEYTNEKSDSVQACSRRDRASEGSRNGTDKQTPSKCVTRTESITSGPSCRL